MRKTLIVRFSSLGDVVISLTAVDALAARGDEIHFLTKEAFAPLVKMSGKVIRVHTIPNHASLSELVSVVRGLKAFQFSEVIDLHRNLRSLIVTVLLATRARRVRKFRFKEWALMVLRRRVFRKLFCPIFRSREVLEATAVEPCVVRPPARLGTGAAVLPRLTDDVRAALTAPYLCIAPESAWAEKEWPLARFEAVAQVLASQGVLPVWLGLKRLSSQGRSVCGVDLTGRLEIEEVATVLSQARLLVSNDSGLMHVAEAVGTPVVAIFGPTSVEFGFGPQLPASRVVEAELWCRPCSKTGRVCIRPVRKRKCLDDVAPEMVVAAIKNVLGSASSIGHSGDK